jgi:coenzyme F420-reducing hydrogenase gamma subunit
MISKGCVTGHNLFRTHLSRVCIGEGTCESRCYDQCSSLAGCDIPLSLALGTTFFKYFHKYSFGFMAYF